MQSSNTRSIGPCLCELDHEQIDRLPVLAQIVDDIIEARVSVNAAEGGNAPASLLNEFRLSPATFAAWSA